MRLPHLHVLATQPWQEGSPQPGVNVLKVRAGNCECNTRAEMTKATDVSRDWAVLNGNCGHMRNQLISVFAGQTMKHRQVSRQEISIRRKVLLTQKIEWLKVVLLDMRREDEGM